MFNTQLGMPPQYSNLYLRERMIWKELYMVVRCQGGIHFHFFIPNKIRSGVYPSP